ncbi:hypothetical protein FKW77_003736 [Venturia effusa]|uniref:Rhodopsin domain-containing protein n=1 Tax=Venturia effusa TaxID=50376 RepID=A0A517L902_9PEZI|nr:hypothetical protein FKW77_003736 [Venturia effusa]
MRDIPAEVIAKWPPANYINPETRGNTVVIVNIVLMSLVAFVVSLRLYVRIYLLRWFGLDDVFIIIALIATAGFTTCMILANVQFGWSRHIWDIPLERISAALQVEWAIKMLYATAACFTRQSLLLSYYRLVQDASMKSFRRVIHVASIYSVLTMLILLLLNLVQCDPIRAFWIWPQMPNSRCWDDGILTVGCGIANTVADLMVTIIPIPLIARLDLPGRRRVGAFIFVGTGFLICAAGAARAFYTWRSLVSSYDSTWESYGMFISAAIEINLGVICACVPTLRILFVKFANSAISAISSHLSQTTPFDTKMTIQSEYTSSFSDRTLCSPVEARVLKMVAKGPGIMISSSSILGTAVASTSMKEDRIINARSTSALSTSRTLTPSNGRSTSALSTSRTVTPMQYMWDEPWSGDNAPRTMLDSKIEEEGPKLDLGDAVTTTISAKKAHRMSLASHRANEIRVSTSTSIIRTPSRTLKALAVAEQAGIGILPGAASPGESLRHESSDDDDDLDLPIQGGSGSQLTVTSSDSFIASRLSWLHFVFDTFAELDGPRMSKRASNLMKLSWLDDKSCEDLHE